MVDGGSKICLKGKALNVRGKHGIEIEFFLAEVIFNRHTQTRRVEKYSQRAKRVRRYCYK